MKPKFFTGIKRCSAGEVYRFKDGMAVVPGLLIGRQKVLVSIQEFRSLQQETLDLEGLNIEVMVLPHKMNEDQKRIFRSLTAFISR